MHWPILILSFLVLSSCGKSNSNAGMPKDYGARKPITNEVVPLKKYFLANLTAVNPTVTGDLSGRFTVTQTSEIFQGKMSLSTPIWHQDSIHTGSRCPTIADDTNGDMVIDATEANAVVGSVLVSLNDRARLTYFKGTYDLAGKVVLLKSSTEALACGVLKEVSSLPSDTDYEPRPTPTPTPDPEPRPTPDTDSDDSEEEDDDEDDTWADRWNDWWRCRLGGCD